MIKNLVFDFGGVVCIWDPFPMYFKHFGNADKANWFLENICPFSWNLLQDEGRSIEEGVRERIALFPEYEKEIRMYYGNFPEVMHGMIPGMYEYLSSLKNRGYHIWGLTNWASETFAIARRMYPVFDLMEDIVISSVEKVRKPDPKLYRILLERNGLKASECLFTDDRKENVDTAISLGMQGIVFQSTEQFTSELEPLLKQR